MTFRCTINPLSLVGALLIWIFGPALSEEPALRPSFAEPSIVTVKSGEIINIPLRAKGASQGTRYLIRSQPQHGSLGEIQQKPNGEAYIAYTHDASKGTEEDLFTYAVQNPGAAVSSRAEVKIHIQSPPPKLKVTPTINFGKVLIGTSVIVPFKVTNIGGQKYVGTISAPPPWRVPEDQPQITLSPDSTAEISLTFNPDSEGDFKGELAFTPKFSPNIQLIGSGIAPFDVAPRKITLKPDKNLQRSGHVEITNQSQNVLELSLESSPEIQTTPSLHLSGGETRQITLTASSNDKRNASGKLMVKEGRFSIPVEIIVEALPGRLKIEPFSEIDFGAFPANQSAEGHLSLSNIGGTPIYITLLPPRWIVTNKEEVALEPGEEKKIILYATANKPGILTGQIIIVCDNKKYHLNTLAKIDAPAFNQDEGKTANQYSAHPKETEKKKLSRAEIAGDALQINDIFQEGHNIYLTWKDPFPKKRNYQIERQFVTSRSVILREKIKLKSQSRTGKSSTKDIVEENAKYQKALKEAMQNDKVVTLWLPVSDVSYTTQNDGLILATFPAPPGRQVTVRVSSKSLDGKQSPFHSVIHIPLKDHPSSPWSTTFYYAGLVILAAFFGFVWWKARQKRLLLKPH